MQDDRIQSGKQLAENAANMYDSDVRMIGEVVTALSHKYSKLPNTAPNLEKLRDEALTKLAEKGILVEIDVTPCFYGQPPNIDILGKVSTDDFHKYGLDHEKKGWEVKKSKDRGEDFYGQKDTSDPASKAAKKKKSK